MLVEKTLDPPPGVFEHVSASEIMKLSGIDHELERLPSFKEIVDETHRVQVGHVDVGGAMENEKRPLEAVHAAQRRGYVVRCRVAFGRAQPPEGPGAVPGVLIVHPIVDDAGDVDTAGEGLGSVDQSQESEETAVAQAPDADAIRIDVAQSLQISRRLGRVRRDLSADATKDALPPPFFLA